VVNAFNDLAKNSIEFPAGVFEVPLFDMEAPMYINYGAIGSIIGHEITHGFDRAGMQFDAEGAMVNWWSNASVLQYENKRRVPR
jgi:predicted metalloendopeptidase